MLTVILTTIDPIGPIRSENIKRYKISMNEKNYYQQTLKLLFWLKEKKYQILNIEYRNW